MVYVGISVHKDKIFIPNPLPAKWINKLLVLIEVSKYEFIKIKILYLDRIYFMR